MWAKHARGSVIVQNGGRGFAPLEGRFVLVVTTHPGTRKDGKPKVLRGDVDNYAKLIADCLQGILYDNDKQAWSIVGAEGEAWPGPDGGQTIDIVWPESKASVSGAFQAFLTALELGGYVDGS